MNTNDTHTTALATRWESLRSTMKRDDRESPEDPAWQSLLDRLPEAS